jgi:hypothetical protein
MPPEYLGRWVWVRWDGRLVRVFNDRLEPIAVHLGKRNPKALPPLTRKQILAWADAHQRRWGSWPKVKSGPIPDALGETWGSVHSALYAGGRGWPGGSSLARFLAKYRGVPCLIGDNHPSSSATIRFPACPLHGGGALRSGAVRSAAEYRVAEQGPTPDAATACPSPALAGPSRSPAHSPDFSFDFLACSKR